MTYYSTKEYPDLGPVAYRQWRADSHCKLIHGYSLSFKFTFGCEDLDARNWCVDFGGLQGLKSMLEDNFDHVLLVAQDDPELEWFKEAAKRGIAKVNILPALGCERLAEMVASVTEIYLTDAGYGKRVWVHSVEVREHSKNSAIFSPVSPHV